MGALEGIMSFDVKHWEATAMVPHCSLSGPKSIIFQVLLTVLFFTVAYVHRQGGCFSMAMTVMVQMVWKFICGIF